jgi:hypothetical protein
MNDGTISLESSNCQTFPIQPAASDQRATNFLYDAVCNVLMNEMMNLIWIAFDLD